VASQPSIEPVDAPGVHRNQSVNEIGLCLARERLCLNNPYPDRVALAVSLRMFMFTFIDIGPLRCYASNLVADFSIWAAVCSPTNSRSTPAMESRARMTPPV
jgi:hypothetical protein